MKLTVALLLVSLALCCYSATAGMCPKVFELLTKYLVGTREALLESIAPFVTRDIMKNAVNEVKACLLNLPQKDAKAITEFFLDFGEKC